MGWRSVFIANPARLSTGGGRLQVEQEGEAASVPLEDLGALVLESPQVSLTVPLLRELAENRVPLFVCDRRHLPCGVLLPFHAHCRQEKVLRAQMGLSRPFAKNCWQRVVRRKILNQAACLRFLDLPGAEELHALASQVRSGDPDQREGVAARLYFSRLMPGRTRDDPTSRNAALDYGYSVLRGALARSLAAHGFLPALGIQHHNELNPFNLADDLLEPFRPQVDLWVFRNVSDDDPFSPEHRASLVGLLHRRMEIQGERHTILRGTELCAEGFAAACREKNPDLLALPALISPDG
ncbi:type II CRISPR-associated endonuclease Cas1 [Aminomonas paucivorans]|uniref:type II CRISPR-associated endonuclease Cas1 n=1 Tax=Aminomonas paucivorans TaxID=81412 RepID=UPI0033240C2A